MVHLADFWKWISPGMFIGVMGLIAASLAVLQRPKGRWGKGSAIFVFTVLTVLELRILRRETKAAEDHFGAVMAKFEGVQSTQAILLAQFSRTPTQSCAGENASANPVLVKAYALSDDILRFLLERGIQAPLDADRLSAYNAETTALYSQEFGSRINELKAEARKDGITIPTFGTPRSVNEVRTAAAKIGRATVNPYARMNNLELTAEVNHFRDDVQSFESDQRNSETSILASQANASRFHNRQAEETASKDLEALETQAENYYQRNFCDKAQSLRDALLGRLGPIALAQPTPLNDCSLKSGSAGQVAAYLESLAQRLPH